MSREINNNDRFWFVVFTIWCKIHGKDHTDPELDQKTILTGLEPEDYDRLHDHAAYEILSAGHCPVCWDTLVPGPRVDVECQLCKTKIELDHPERQATVTTVEEEE